jgi:hypothetical protein
VNLQSGPPFVAAILAIGVALSWFGTLIVPRYPGWVSVVIDIILIWVVPFVGPFKKPGSQCGSLWSSCDPSWSYIAGQFKAVPALSWAGAAAALAVPVILCPYFARRRRGPAGREPAYYPPPRSRRYR